MNCQTITMSDGTLLETVSVEPVHVPKGHIHLVHGMAEHIGRYEEVMTHFAHLGYIVTGHNQRGHGQQALSQGQLGDFADGVTFDRLVEDVKEVLDTYKVRYPGLSLVLLGHSMGSFVARRFSQKYGAEIDGLICSGTAGKSAVTTIGGSLLASILSAKNGSHVPSSSLDAIGFGGYNKTVHHPETKFDWLSTDRETVRNYIEDPLSGAVSTNQYYQVLFEGLKRISRMKEYDIVPKTLPVLFISGTEDPVGNMGSGVFEAAEMYAEAGVSSVTVHLLEGVRHETLQGAAREKALSVIERWVASR